MRVLFVDDEAHLLSGLRRLTRANRHWTSHFALSGVQALELLRETEVDAVVTDMRMPGMDGLELLRALEVTHPQLARIVLTGHVDTDRGRLAEPLAHGWLNKPCSLEALNEVVESAVDAATDAART